MAGRSEKSMAGAYAAMYTPFTPDNRLDEATIERQVEFGLANGLRGFYLTGTTGEGMLMSFEERTAVYRRVVAAAAGRARIIAHVGALSTDEAVRLARAAADIGCDWASSIWPVFYGRSFPNAYSYYKAVSSATDLPFMVYALGTEVVPERDARLFELPHVKGMKYTGHSVWNVARLRHRIGPEALFFAGADEQALCSMALKDVFCGCIGTSQNSVPYIFAELCDSIARDDLSRAAQLQDQVIRLVDVMLARPNASWHKAFMRYVGIDCGAARSPNGSPLSAEEYAELCGRLDALGFVKRIAG